jgi:membrane protein DedA with SNARE-associated domain
MPQFPLLSHFIIGSLGGSAFLSLGIILGVIFLEDTTTVIVGVLAADKLITIPHGLFSLYAGIVIGDIGLYCLGYLASTHPRLAHYVDHDFIAPFRAWLEARFVLTVFTARFIPGARLPTYTASGFFRSPLTTFMLTAIGATSVWTTFLFTASYWFGNVTAGWMGPVRWGIALAFVLILFLVGRHNVLAYRIKRDELGTDDGIRAK